MFSQQQLDKMRGKKRISQETFDAAVKENIEEFEMEAEEAVASAVQEFEAQGVDLTGIIKTASGGDTSSHPASLAVKALDAAVGAAEQEAILAALAGLQELLAGADSSGREELLTVLFRAEAAWALVRCLTSWPESQGVALPALRLLPPLLANGPSSRDHQKAFLQVHGAKAIAAVLGKHAGQPEVQAAALAAAAAFGVRNEDGKAAVVEAGLHIAALRLLAGGGGAASEGGAAAAAAPAAGLGPGPELVQAACAVIISVTNPDDDTQPSSRAFPNARALGKEGGAEVLVGALRRAAEGGQPPETVATLCTALKAVAANNEICQEVDQAGGVALALRILIDGMDQPAIARPACALLRQLASSDGIKASLVEVGGLAAVVQLLHAHPPNYPLLEQALGLLTNVTLRNPEAAARAVECGCGDAVLEAMQGLIAAGDAPATQHPQRQACMALRNIASRSSELRPLLLDKGAEATLRGVKQAYPGPAYGLVREAASAALRDLGLDNYNG